VGFDGGVPRSPTPPEPNAAFLLIALGRRAQARVDEALARDRISYRHLSALGHLGAGPEMSYSELARRASVTPQSMQATLAHLEGLGIVERVGGTGQGQRARLAITASGRRVLARARSAVNEVEATMLADLAAPSADQLRRLLREVFANSVQEKP